MLTTSYSSMTTFLRCPRQWYLGEVRRLVPKVEKRTGPLGFGGRIHEALERAWVEDRDLLAVWGELMAAEYAYAQENALDNAELQKEDTLGRVMLGGLEEWESEVGEDQEYEVIGVEVQLSNKLLLPTGVEVLMYGKLDRLLKHRDTGDLMVKDWKTTKDLEDTFKNTIEASPQPRLYSALVAQDTGIRVSGVRYTSLRKVLQSARAKPPFYFNFDLDLPDYNVDQHLRRAVAVTTGMVDTIERLENGVDHTEAAAFNPGWYCTGCPFRAPCLVMQHDGMEAAEELLEDKYIEGDPFARYMKHGTEDE